MRHKAQVSHFGRETAARKSLIRGLVCSLVEHGRIKTTLAKAKELRRHAERAVTIAKQGSLHARRLLLARYPNKAAVETMMSELGPEFKTRNGGYTRIIKLGPRPGDNAPMALIEWVNYEGPAETEVLEADEAGVEPDDDFYDQRDRQFYDSERRKITFHCIRCDHLYTEKTGTDLAQCPRCNHRNTRLKF